MTNKMKVLFLTKNKKLDWWEKMVKDIHKYFEIQEIYDKPKSIKKYFDTGVDILFLDTPEVFEWDHYKSFKINNQSFTYIALREKEDPNADYIILKDSADRLIYTSKDPRVLKWEIISILRRYWNIYSKPSTIIYRGIVADFVESKFIVDKKEVFLTPRESSILRVLLNNKKTFISKQKIFKIVWGHEEDNTRTVDQTIFKLKRKIGKGYIIIKRNEGVMIG